MPPRDSIHNLVKQALIKDGWEITDDPYVISYGKRFLFIDLAAVKVYFLVENTYQTMSPNPRGHFSIAYLGVELGIWQGWYTNAELPWLRWWDAEGNLLLTGDERAEVERQRAEVEQQKREILVEKLRSLSPEQLNSLGINPEILE